MRLTKIRKYISFFSIVVATAFLVIDCKFLVSERGDDEEMEKTVAPYTEGMIRALDLISSCRAEVNQPAHCIKKHCPVTGLINLQRGQK